MNTGDEKPTRACKRPCHDCPFRKDIKPYQSPQDVLRNVRMVLDPAATAVCHQTVRAIVDRRGQRKTIPGGHHVCGGFLAFLAQIDVNHHPVWEKLGLSPSNYWAHANQVFGDLLAFVKGGQCPRGEDALENWYSDQPPHLAARLRVMRNQPSRLSEVAAMLKDGSTKRSTVPDHLL